MNSTVGVCAFVLVSACTPAAEPVDVVLGSPTPSGSSSGSGSGSDPGGMPVPDDPGPDAGVPEQMASPDAAEIVPPSVTLSASSFSTTPDANGAYAYNTTLVISASVTNADTCTRIGTFPGTPGWTGTGSTPLTVKLKAPGETYQFALQCQTSSGTITSNTITVSTNCDNIAPPGFVRAAIPRTWPDFQGAEFPNKDLSKAKVPVVEYSNLTFFGATRGQYTAIVFTNPAGNTKSNISVDDTQIPNTNVAASLEGNYWGISRCPGDFRFAIKDPQVPTEFQTCKSVRMIWSRNEIQGVLGIGYNQTGISGDPYAVPYDPNAINQCGLEAGKTYYLNYINANATDGIAPGEHTCWNDSDTCGVQMQHK